MCMYHMQQCTSICLKFLWNDRDLVFVKDFLNDYFEQTADWSDAVADMGLDFCSDKPYPHLVVQGDYYLDADWRMSQFALDCSGHVILIASGADDRSAYFLLSN